MAARRPHGLRSRFCRWRDRPRWRASASTRLDCRAASRRAKAHLRRARGYPFGYAGAIMTDNRLSIRIDLTNGDRIGPGKIALLEAIRATGSISAAARRIGMSYRRAWLLVEEVNASLQQPAVTAAIGGRQGGGAALTLVGERIIELY